MAQKARSKPAKRTLLNQTFWQNFAKNTWEKKELVARKVQSELLQMGDAEIFDLLVLYADRCRDLNDPEGFKFFIDGFKVEPEEVLQVLPEKSDQSLLGYHARMNKLFPDYCLVCDELLKVNLKKQQLLTDFTDQLYKHVGFPNRFSEMGLYLGNYRKTPFGVHVDSCGVFSFPVVGVKRFRLWSPEFVKKNPALDRAFTYEKFKKNSTLLEARPGDMTYWPSSAWHIAESDGSFSATWSLGVWVDQPLLEMLSGALKALLYKKSGALATRVSTKFKNLHSENGEVTELPPSWAKSLQVLQSLSEAELQDRFLETWMKHISLQGFKNIPQGDLQLKTTSVIQLRNPRALILWKKNRNQKDSYSLSFGGLEPMSSRSKDLLKLVQDLNAGKPCQINQFLKTSSKAQDLIILQSLANASAFSDFQA